MLVHKLASNEHPFTALCDPFAELCGSSNTNDNNLPASHFWRDVTCGDCLALRPHAKQAERVKAAWSFMPEILGLLETITDGDARQDAFNWQQEASALVTRIREQVEP